MDGKNSSGRKVSLLNDSQAAAAAAFQHSPSSSYSSTPCQSPQTPPLTRSDSGIQRSPSPITPNHNSPESLPHSQRIAQPYYLSSYAPGMDKPGSIYPPVPQATSTVPYSVAGSSQPVYPRASSSPTSERRLSVTPIKSAPKKNQYPCPMAKAFGCTDYFTTSGHAARHAKKHTGKKDAFCPECNKAFTRKDNMEQHRRTHQNGRSSTKVGEEPRAKKAKVQQPPRKPRPPPLQVEMPMVEQQGPMSGGPYYAAPVQPFPQPVVQDFDGRPQLYHTNYTNSFDYAPPPPSDTVPQYNYPSPGLSSGLDILSLAACDHKRKFEL
ncbi:hypothetical protein LTR04_002276 [Oleoguttula sp. CCFEE 6159]|nr:hypothetical protein LTR04_002276 [Oleoguttula sp. CCFEE 6159]